MMPASPASRLPALLAAAALAFAGPAAADELRLRDGRIIVGKVTSRADTYEVATRDGVVVVAKAEVESHRDDDALRRDLADQTRRAGPGAFGQLQLAIQARAYGLEPELWRHLDRVVAQPGGSDALQRQLADFLGQLEPELLPRKWRRAPTSARVHQLLDLLRADTGPGRTAAIEELLVREPNADQDLRQQARRNSAPRRRVGALSALQRRELAGNDRFVLRTAVLDGSAEVRQAAAALGRGKVTGDDVVYLATGLGHENAKVRVRTAEALGTLGHADAVKLLVLAGPHAAVGVAAGGGDGVRGHIAILQQQAYIRDYDVEVAQAAFIADPKIDVLQSGSVLDVTVAGVVEVRTIVHAYRQALKQLTAHDPGDDPRRWAAWMAALPQAPAPTPTTGRR